MGHPFSEIARDRRLRAGPLLSTVACLAVLNALVFTWKGDLEAQRQANLLVAGPVMGRTAPGAAAPDPAEAPRFDWSVGEDLGHYWPSIPDARKAPLVILSGMSQMYAINETKTGDETIAEHMDDALRTEGVRVFGLAAPNLDNEEATVYVASVSEAPETRPRVFLYGLCFDKFRNVDVRTGLLSFLRARPELQEAYRSVCDGRREKYPLACEKVTSTLASVHQPGAAAKEGSFEDSLRAMAARALPMVDARADLNAMAQYEAFLLRNWVFHIEPSSKRPIIQSRYELNKQFLQIMIDVAKGKGVQMALYVIPLNPLAENPYVPEEYAAFKRWAADLAAAEGVPFENLEGVVPEGDWGEFMGGPDFKHFKGEGHALTARTLVERFGPVIRRAAGTAP